MTAYMWEGLERISSNGSGSTLTKYFTGASGLPTAERVGTNGPLSYLASDGQGTVSAALDSSGNVTSSQLYMPYGVVRYSSGSSPTSIGYTGQRADSATGLDYYQARYYDPTAGQFISADSADDGTNRYGYVGGNPTTATDPSGHRCYNGDGGVCGSPPPTYNPPTTPPTGCHSDGSCGCYSNCGSPPSRPCGGAALCSPQNPSGGDNGSTGNSTTSDSVNCDRACDALHWTVSAAVTFTIIAALAAALGGLATGAGASNPFTAFFFGVAAGALFTLGVIAAAASVMLAFADSTSSRDEFEMLREQIHQVLGALAALIGVLTPILNFLTPLVKNIPLLLGSTEAVGGGTIEAGTTLSGGALTFGIVSGLVVGGLVGMFVLTPLADFFLDHIESDLYA